MILTNRALQPFFAAFTVFCCFFLFASFASAEENVDMVDTEIVLNETGAAQVRHLITVQAEGDQIRRGIYLRIPSSIGPIKDFAVTRNGEAEGYSFDGRSVRLGRADVFLDPGSYTYELTYLATSPLKEQEDGSVQLYWPPIVNQFDLPWSESRIVIDWPDQIRPINFDGDNLTIALSSYVTEEPVPVQVSWEANAFPAEAIRTDPDNRLLKYGAITAIIMALMYFHQNWLAYGKDLPARQIHPRSSTPAGISAGASRYIKRMSYDATCMVAALASLVTKGALNIEVIKKGKIELHKVAMPEERLSQGEIALMNVLFAKENPVSLSASVGLLGKAISAHGKALKQEFGDRYFKDNQDIWMRGFLGCVAAIITLIVLVIMEARAYAQDDLAMIVGIASAIVLLLVPLIYYSLMRAPTRSGRVLMDEIEGLKQYLKGDGDMPEATGEEFVRLLPYAIALEAEKEWIERFGDDLPDTDNKEVQAFIDWYKKLKANSKASEDAIFVAAILPAVTASSSGSSAVAAGGGGASAGGW